MILPQNPGLERRKAYSNIIKHRNRNIGRNPSHFHYNNLVSSEHNTQGIQNIRFGSFETFYGDSWYGDPWDNPYPNFYNENDSGYEELSLLKDVRIGLINKNLVDKSTVSINIFKDNFCVICQEYIHLHSQLEKSIIRILQCSHCFHIKCIDTWFIENKTCPTCKTNL